MKTVPMPYEAGRRDSDPVPPIGTEFADHRDDPEEVLKAVDRQLKKFGLCVTLFDNQDDMYWWDIDRIPEKEFGSKRKKKKQRK